MNIPILDSHRADPSRIVVEEFPPIQPFLPEADAWVEFPIRITTASSVGLRIEVGPYELPPRDIEVLREAIAAFDKAVSA